MTLFQILCIAGPIIAITGLCLAFWHDIRAILSPGLIWNRIHILMESTIAFDTKWVMEFDVDGVEHISDTMRGIHCQTSKLIEEQKRDLAAAGEDFQLIPGEYFAVVRIEIRKKE